MRRLGTLCLVLLAIIGLSCQPNFPNRPTYDLEANLARDAKIIDEFLKTAQIDSVRRIHDQNGVIIIVQEEGTGSRPGEFRLIYTNYIGKFLDGKVFDTNLEQVAKDNNIWDQNRIYRIFQFVLGSNEAIQGFNIGFRRLKSGSKAVLIIPSSWAYRDQKRDDIPPNSILMFEVEFLGFE